jgi:Tfp pilus assembly protein PilN
MIEINLLPKELQWRRFRFSLDKKLVVLLVAGLILILGMAAYSFVFQASQISTYKKNIASYKAETEKFAAEIKKIDEIKLKNEQITARMTAIEMLTRNQDYWVNLLEDMVRRIPEYLWLTSVQEASAVTASRTQTGAAAAAPSKSSIEGYSFSLNALATFIVRLKKSEIFHNIEISSITLQETEKAKAYFFKLTCDFDVPQLAVQTESTTQPATGTAGSQF